MYLSCCPPSHYLLSHVCAEVGISGLTHRPFCFVEPYARILLRLRNGLPSFPSPYAYFNLRQLLSNRVYPQGNIANPTGTAAARRGIKRFRADLSKDSLHHGCGRLIVLLSRTPGIQTPSFSACRNGSRRPLRIRKRKMPSVPAGRKTAQVVSDLGKLIITFLHMEGYSLSNKFLSSKKS